MKGIAIILAIIAFAMCAIFFQKHAEAILLWIDTLGLLAPLFFVIIYCLATLLFLPTMIITLAGGALFGPILGIFYNILGASLGAACAFFISRYLMYDWVISKQNSRINSLITGVEQKGWQFVAILRLIPVIPFNLVNYGLGLTDIKFSHYLITTVIFLIPIEILSTYCGYASLGLLIHSELAWIQISILMILIAFLSVYLVRKIR